MSDNRIKDGGRALREPQRDERSQEDRSVTEDRSLTDDERLRMLQQGFYHEALPDLPPKEGFHRIWLTTSNSRDPIAGRIRFGYRLLTYEDLGPGWTHTTQKSAEYPGVVSVNEMLAAELPIGLYQKAMALLHHAEPNRMEAGIRRNLDEMAGELAGKGSALIQEPSLGELGRERQRSEIPEFS